MKCKSASRLISQCIDDRLGQDVKSALLRHVENCPACKKSLEETLAVHQIFASTGRFSAPHGFATRVMASLEKESPRLPKWMGPRLLFLRTAEVLFALVVLILGVVSGSLLLEEKTPLDRHAEVRESFSLDLFQPAPPGSVGGVYLAYVGGTR